MAEVRAKGADVVVRFSGRRLRITADWSEVSDDALQKLKSESGDQIEVKSEATSSMRVPREEELDTDTSKNEGRSRGRGKSARKSDDEGSTRSEE